MTRTTGLTLLEPATTLEDVYKTLSPEPLMTRPEIEAFYRGELNEVRGGDKVGTMALGLERSRRAGFYKAFLMGHPGVGKSTELTRLVGRRPNCPARAIGSRSSRTRRFSAASTRSSGPDGSPFRRSWRRGAHRSCSVRVG